MNETKNTETMRTIYKERTLIEGMIQEGYFWAVEWIMTDEENEKVQMLDCSKEGFSNSRELQKILDIDF